MRGHMDELEKLLAFVEIEVSLVKGLEQISETEMQHLEDLDNWADTVLDTSAS